MNQELNQEAVLAQARLRRAIRYDNAVLSAEVARLVRVLRAGSIQRRSLPRISPAERGRERSFDRAVTQAIRARTTRALPGESLAPGRPAGARSVR